MSNQNKYLYLYRNFKKSTVMEANSNTPETTLRVQSVVYPPNWVKNRENKAMHFLKWMVKIQNIHYASQERMSNAIEKINTQQ